MTYGDGASNKITKGLQLTFLAVKVNLGLLEVKKKDIQLLENKNRLRKKLAKKTRQHKLLQTSFESN